MKTVFLVRHGKSSWEYSSLRDIERPLNERGLRDSPFMAKLIVGKGIKPDLLVSSPAIRALTTATFFKTELGMDGKDLLVRDLIYEASLHDILELIHELSDEFETVMLFGHNPTFTSVANHFNSGYIDNIPTCGIVQIVANVEHWNEFSDETASLIEFYYPKQYF